MPSIKTVDLDVADESTTGFASNVTGAAFTLTATAPTDGLAHQVSIHNDSATDHSGKTVTLVGTDADGIAQTEVVTAPAGTSTVESSKYFKTLTSATPSATIGADTFDIGWVDEVASRTIMLNHRAGFGAMLQSTVTGTVSYTWQISITPRSSVAPLNAYGGQESFDWINTTNSNLVSATASKVGDIEPQVVACRKIINSYSSGARVLSQISEERRF